MGGCFTFERINTNGGPKNSNGKGKYGKKSANPFKQANCKNKH